MKNLEINSKAVKKLSMAVLMTGVFTLGGCATGKEQKPTQEPTEEVEKPIIEVKGSEDFSLKKMTKEETLALTSGMEIDKLPDREVLESMGLDYEFEMIVDNTFEDGSEETLKRFLYDVPEKLEVINVEDERGKQKLVQKFSCIRILSIQNLQYYPETDKWSKTITFSDGKPWEVLILNEANREKIEASLGSIAYVKTIDKNFA